MINKLIKVLNTQSLYDSNTDPKNYILYVSKRYRELFSAEGINGFEPDYVIFNDGLGNQTKVYFEDTTDLDYMRLFKEVEIKDDYLDFPNLN